jgi:hypothetical protein
MTCSTDGDFYGDRVLIEDWVCVPDDCEPMELGCTCDSGGQCDDERFCNGVESCGTERCLPGIPPCAAEDCVEYVDLCLDRCPGEQCDGSPACTAVETGVNACRSDYGAVLGCPVGQTIHAAACACDGGVGQSWTCE